MSGYNAAPALYCGNGKQINRIDKEPFFAVELDMTMLQKHITPDMVRKWRGRDGVTHECIKLILAPIREPTEHKTHSLKIDTWKPQARKQEQATSDDVKRVQNHFAPQEEMLCDEGEVPF